MTGKIQKSNNRNKTHLLWVMFSKNKRLNYVMFPALIIMFMFIFVFQNCQRRNNPTEGEVIKESNPSSSTTTSTLTASLEDKAIFEISEKYTGEKTISHIRWQVTHGPEACYGDDVTVAEGTESNIEVDWSSFLGKEILVEAFIQFEGDDCITYRQQRLMVSKLKGVSCSSDMYRFDITSTLSSDDSLEPKRYFPIGSFVELEFKLSGPDEPGFDSFAWSVQKIFVKDDSQVDDFSTESLTYSFSEIGLYNVVAEASRNDSSATTTTTNSSIDSASASAQLLIGRCEGGDLSDIEIVLSEDSLGSETPKNILGPIWNYVRPADTDPGVDIMTLNIENYRFGQQIYRYPRESRSKFIDIDIENVDECFLDQNPISSEMCTTMGCSESNPDCNTCWTEYQIREDISPLSSCNDNALDMSEIDLDTTECTEDIFAIAVSKEIDISLLPKPEPSVSIPSSDPDQPEPLPGSLPSEPVSSTTIENQNAISSITDDESKGAWRSWWGAKPRVFYKHCPADSDYCYFGPEAYRPEEHHCPTDE